MLSDAWSSVLGIIPGPLFIILAVVGVVIVVGALLKWGWDRRRGGGGGFPWAAVVLGAVLAGPKLLIPILLGIVDVAIVIVGNIIKAITGMLH